MLNNDYFRGFLVMRFIKRHHPRITCLVLVRITTFNFYLFICFTLACIVCDRNHMRKNTGKNIYIGKKYMKI